MSGANRILSRGRERLEMAADDPHRFLAENSNNGDNDDSDYHQDDSIHEVTLQDFLEVLTSDLAETLGWKEDGSVEERAAAVARYVQIANFDYSNAVEKEIAYYAGEEGVEFGDMLYAYVICMRGPKGESARVRKANVYNYVVTHMQNISSANEQGVVMNVTDAAYMQRYLESLETVFNGPEMTCSYGKFRSSIMAVIASMKGTGTVPLNSIMKIRGGVVTSMLGKIFPGGGYAKDGSNLQDMDAQILQQDAFTPEALDVDTCAGTPPSDIARLETKVTNFMLSRNEYTDASTNQTVYESVATAQALFGNLTSAQIQALPDRLRFWYRVFELGIDSPMGCRSYLERLDATLVSSESAAKAAGEFPKATVRITLTEIDFDHFQNDMACTFGLLFSLALLPQVCSLELVQIIENDSNADSQWITQGGRSTGEGGSKKITDPTSWFKSQDGHSRPFWEMGIQGEGQIVAISDSGLDADHCYFQSDNPLIRDKRIDTTQRKIVQYDPYVDDVDEPAGHGTHCAGTIAGHKSPDGGATSSDGTQDGVARNAKIAFIDTGAYCGPGCGTLSIPPTDRLMNTGSGEGLDEDSEAKVHSASWGISFNRQGLTYQYDSTAKNMDNYLANHWDKLMVVAAGNDGRDRGKSMNSPGIAKNVLTVGAGLTSPFDMVVDFSSEGPTPDGRIAPMIVAPGAQISSAKAEPAKTGECEADGALTTKSGTSMATPAVAGSAALVRQYFMEGYYPTGAKDSSASVKINPSGTLVKAILLNSGQSMKGKRVGGEDVDSVPYDNIQGFGLVSLADALRLSGKNNIVARAVDKVEVEDGQEMEYEVVVNKTICNGEEVELRATLVWPDPAGTSGCRYCLIADLDLTLTDEDGNVYLPNGLTSGKDSTNNAERIVISPSDVEDGKKYTATVKAANLDRKTQAFSMAMSGCFNFDGQEDIQFAKPAAAPSFVGRSVMASAMALLGAAYLML